RNHVWGEQLFGAPVLNEPPSRYIKQHAYWGFFDDPVGMKLRHEVGVDRIIWGSDFPHVVTTWPHSQAVLERELEGAPQGEKQGILAGNLIEFLGLDATEQ